MRNLCILLIPACLLLSACATIRDGVVVDKRSRSGLPQVYEETLTAFDFRYEPSIYWVKVKANGARTSFCSGTIGQCYG